MGSIGIAQIKPETAAQLLNDLWGIELDESELVYELTSNDRFSVVIAAAALHDARSRIHPPTHRTRQNIFVGYAVDPDTIVRLNDIDWDYDEINLPDAQRRAETHYPSANSHVIALQNSIAESFGGGWHTQPDPPGSDGDMERDRLNGAGDIGRAPELA